MCAGFILPLADAMVYLFLLVQAAALVYTLYVAIAHKKFWQIVLYWVLFIPALLIFYMQLYVSVLVVLALCVFATFLMKFTRKKGKKGKDDKAPEASEMPENEEKPAETAVSTDETSDKEENPQI